MAAWSVALSFKLWCCTYPSHISFECKRLQGQVNTVECNLQLDYQNKGSGIKFATIHDKRWVRVRVALIPGADWPSVCSGESQNGRWPSRSNCQFLLFFSFLLIYCFMLFGSSSETLILKNMYNIGKNAKTRVGLIRQGEKKNWNDSWEPDSCAASAW